MIQGRLVYVIPSETDCISSVLLSTAVTVHGVFLEKAEIARYEPASFARFLHESLQIQTPPHASSGSQVMIERGSLFISLSVHSLPLICISNTFATMSAVNHFRSNLFFHPIVVRILSLIIGCFLLECTLGDVVCVSSCVFVWYL